MCKSAAQGGQRCAAHTRPAFQQTLPRARDTGHEAAFDHAAIEHATTKQGRVEVEALMAFATRPRERLRIENLLNQADQLRLRREAVTAEVDRHLRTHQGGRHDGAQDRRNAATSTAPGAPGLTLVYSSTDVVCETCEGTGTDYDGYWGCEDCHGEGTQPADTRQEQ